MQLLGSLCATHCVTGFMEHPTKIMRGGGGCFIVVVSCSHSIACGRAKTQTNARRNLLSFSMNQVNPLLARTGLQ